MSDTAAMAAEQASADTLADAAVGFKDVGFAWDDHVVLQDVSFRLPKGGMSVLLGASGTGKSLILKLILGLLKPDAGVVSLNGRPLNDLHEHDLLRMRVDTGMVFQENALFD